jgi:hypothetical protein
MDMTSPQQTAPQAPALRRGRLRGLMQKWQDSPPQQRRRTLLLALLALCGLVLNVGIVVLTIRLFVTGPSRVPPPPERRLAVPYAGEAAVWDRLRRWTVQEDGRLKPYDTFCRETVRSVTGRERFEETDPVAVVTAWLLGDADGWEEHPFILCDHQELRALIYRDYHGEDRLTPEERHGKYV